MEYFYFEDYLPLFMFVALACLLFLGYPVAFTLGGIGLAFGLIGMYWEVFEFINYFNIVPRIWGGIAENLILTAVPMFIFMGTMLERSGVAADLLHCLQVLLRRVPGGLALSVTLMGTIMAATTGIIGASVVMMTLLALGVMLDQKYDKALATGTIAASGTLGILIPPSIMLVIMADLLARSVGNLFVAAIVPGFMLAGMYVLYILVRCGLKPSLAPPLSHDQGPESASGLAFMVARSFIPPLFLVFLVLGSIVFGWATPTEAAGVGAGGAVFLALLNRKLSFGVLKDVVERSALTGGMIFGIFLGATCFSYVFRQLGGDHLVVSLVDSLGLGSWGLLLLLMALTFFLGFFFDWIEITLIVLPVFSPIIAALEFGDHVDKFEVVYWFAILLAVNLQTSFLTPPFGFALFYMKGVAPPSIKIQNIYRGIIPFVMIQLVGLGLVMAFPDLALWLPRVMLN
ncbi:TRAP transporter large permease [Denitrobaculum tricleocarpae]|uniref:TRAP transporter large permease protein n=1 Tax=Denitrobaculum tricleocarpae TaxID=2591009 RepID=A0A545TXI5_9PROT|nr:TRAP transporter large permease subunit [Denitrobaculum tricleocarpae]TQV81910.1 TRAP transporter large permease subunit [Denitrobaculum tricleocarpae]